MSARGRTGLYLAVGLVLLAMAGFIEAVSSAHRVALGVGMAGAFALVGWASALKRARSHRQLPSS